MYRKKITDLVLVMAIVATMSGCSAARRSKTPGDGAVAATGSYLYSDIYANNISNSGFFISKVRLEMLVEGSIQRFTASVRKDNSGRWLASIRSFAGIEVMRAYADRDQVVMLDRLGRNATVLGWDELRRNFGLSYDLLPVLVGDIPEMNIEGRSRVKCGSLNRISSGNLNIRLMADCFINRPSTMILTDSVNGREITVTAGQFSSVGGVDYSSVIEVLEKSGLFHVKLNIDNLEVPWIGEVEFSIPSNYKRNR
jgi:hypothetical protein